MTVSETIGLYTTFKDVSKSINSLINEINIFGFLNVGGK